MLSAIWIVLVGKAKLVGGFKPSPKYSSNWIISPRIGVNIKNLWSCHHLEKVCTPWILLLKAFSFFSKVFRPPILGGWAPLSKLGSFPSHTAWKGRRGRTAGLGDLRSPWLLTTEQRWDDPPSTGTWMTPWTFDLSFMGFLSGHISWFFLLVWMLGKNEPNKPSQMVVKNGDESYGIESVKDSPTKTKISKQIHRNSKAVSPHMLQGISFYHASGIRDGLGRICFLASPSGQ